VNKDFKIDFIGIGAAKSGTTWINKCLAEHPEIFISEIKEINYFNKHNFPDISDFNDSGGPLKENGNNSKNLAWYKTHFEGSNDNMLWGEISPSYFADKEAPANIYNTFPNVKLFAVLRNPTERAYSHYWMYKNYIKVEKRSFEDAIKQEKSYIERGMYYSQIKHYLQYFKQEQLLILLLDDIIKNPVTELKKLFTFLGVNTEVHIPSISKKANPARKARSGKAVIFMDKIVRFFIKIHLQFVITLLKKIKFNKLFLKLISKQQKYPPMFQKTREQLNKIFKKENNKLAEFLNKDLSNWN